MTGDEEEDPMTEQDTPSLVCSTARDLLENPEIRLADDFFAVGGDSMLAMHLVGRLARATGLRLRVSLLIAHPVLGDFVQQVETLRHREGLPVGPAASLAAALRSRHAEGTGSAG
jgi:aryl carrier-like protein